jgi:hypothetical protein
MPETQSAYISTVYLIKVKGNAILPFNSAYPNTSLKKRRENLHTF